MPSFFLVLKKVRWYQWILAALALLYIVYIALSYLYLPGKLKQVVQTDVAARIGREITVSRFRFNPFALSLGIEELSVADQPGKPLVGWQRLFVNVGFWKSLFKLEIALDEFSVTRPEINIEKNPAGLNFDDILERFARDDPPEPSAPDGAAESSRMALEIARTAILQGTFRYGDISGSTPVHSDLDDVTIEVEDLYLATGDENLNPFDLTAILPGGGDLRLSGRYRIDPLHVDAEISANAVQLAAFSGFLENILPVKIETGELSFSTRLLTKQEEELVLQTEQGQLEITDLNVADDTPDPALLQAGSISVTGAAMDLGRKRLSVEKVLLDGILATQWMDSSGKMRYEGLLPAEKSAPAPAPIPEPDIATPWEVVVRQTTLQNSTFHFSDLSQATARSHSISEITLTLENVTLTPVTPAVVSFAARLDREGQIRANGNLVLSPFAMAMDYRLENIQLPSFSDYVEDASHLGIKEGRLQVDGSAALNREGKSGLTADLDISINGLRTVDTRTGDALLNLEALDLKEIAVDTGDRTAAIASVALTGPELFSRISGEKQMNLATLSRAGKEPLPLDETAPEPETDNAPTWRFSILSTNITGGTVHYSDQSVSPEFTTGIEALALEVGPIATDRTDPTPFSLTGDIDRYAPLSITGTLLPLDRQPGFTFNTTLEGLEMPGLSPYSATFIGNNLKSGKLSLALDYSLADRMLKGKNNIVAENLYLGEKVPSETALNAPVGLGLALLRNLKGVIDLDVGVAGDLDDPGFSISGIIAKTLLNIITKAAASPFKLLGALVGGDEDLGEVTFAAGESTLTPETEERLRKLSEALAQRPQLALAIQGNASREEDAAALKARQVLEKAAATRILTPAELETGAGENAWWHPPENREALASLAEALGLQSVSERSGQLQAEFPQLQGEDLLTEVYAGIYEDLVNAQEIRIDQLLSLADTRALVIKQHLVDILKLDHQRVSVTKPRESALSGRSLTLEIDAM